jgi:Arc/MetJ-type ribon-helix-helix transcriptional regulator
MQIQILNVRLSKEIVLWLDSMIKEGIYKSRSEAVRDYIRKYIKRSQNKNA